MDEEGKVCLVLYLFGQGSRLALVRGAWEGVMEGGPPQKRMGGPELSCSKLGYLGMKTRRERQGKRAREKEWPGEGADGVMRITTTPANGKTIYVVGGGL